SYFDIINYQSNLSIELVINSILNDTSFCNEYSSSYYNSRMLNELKLIDASKYKHYKVIDYYNDNSNSGVVIYRIIKDMDMIVLYRGSEIYDEHVFNTRWQDWIDNVEMFIEPVTIQQLTALNYINNCDFLGYNVYQCGHSKGGNLALYTSLTTNSNNYSRIFNIIAINTPGLNNDLLEMYSNRSKTTDFLNKVLLIENEHDCVSSFFNHIKEPRIYRSSINNITLKDVFDNHQLYSFKEEEGKYVDSLGKSPLPKVIDNFVNNFFCRLSRDKRDIVVNKMIEYLRSDLPIDELYRVFIYHIGKYISIFDDLSYEEVKNVSFNDLLLALKDYFRVNEIINRKDEILKLTNDKLNELDIKSMIVNFSESYELMLKQRLSEFMNIINANLDSALNHIRCTIDRNLEKISMKHAYITLSKQEDVIETGVDVYSEEGEKNEEAIEDKDMAVDMVVDFDSYVNSLEEKCKYTEFKISNMIEDKQEIEVKKDKNKHKGKKKHKKRV
ncbi:MAG: Mbeg1-like protein, partial [Erysipelotrichaceae bacterium]